MNDDTTPTHILFFDGECVLCNGIVKWLVQRDPERNFAFASLQGETAAEFRKSYRDFPEGLDTFVFYDHGVIRIRSKGALWAVRLMKAPWRWAHIFRFTPAWFGDIFYRFVANNRIKWFGSTDSCWFAPKEDESRFLP